MDGICLSSEHKRIAAWFWWMTDFMGHSGHIFPIKECECACEYSIHVWDVEQEVTFKLAYNNKPSPHSLIIPVCNQGSMAESTPTAYTPNTLTGNLLSPRAFVCSCEWQPANRERESSGKRKTASKLEMVGKIKEAEVCEEREEKKQKREETPLLLYLMASLAASKASLTLFCTETKQENHIFIPLTALPTVRLSSWSFCMKREQGALACCLTPSYTVSLVTHLPHHFLIISKKFP